MIVSPNKVLRKRIEIKRIGLLVFGSIIPIVPFAALTLFYPFAATIALQILYLDNLRLFGTPSLAPNFRKPSNLRATAGVFPIETSQQQGTEATGAFLLGFLTQGLVASAETKISSHVQFSVAFFVMCLYYCW